VEEERHRPRKLIGEFLLELSEHKRSFQHYAQDREKVLAESGLTKEQQEIILSDDLERIRDAVRDEYRSAKVLVVAMFVLITRPPSHGE
jgi:hypothetical protein